jgi:hypothetical protein
MKGGNMGTSLTEISDLFLSSISDYRLDTIFTTSGSLALNTYVEPWLLKSIQEFSVSNQSLAYTPTSGSADGFFTESLTLENQIILSQFMELFWHQKGIQDHRALVNITQDHDFKTHSPGNLASVRQGIYNAKREELSQKLIDYSYRHNSNWENWSNQIFSS